MFVLPWVSSGFPPGRLGFPQVSLPLVLLACAYAMGFRRYVFIFRWLHAWVSTDFLVISFWTYYTAPYVLQVSMHLVHSWYIVLRAVGFLRVSYRFRAGFLQVSRGIPVSFLQVSCNFPLNLLRVSRGFPAGFLQVSRGFPVGFSWVSRRFLVSWRFPEGFLPISRGWPAGFLHVSCALIASEDVGW